MPQSLKNSCILLGVTGSIAAYKAIDLSRRLKEEGADVRVVMTNASKNFVTSLSLEIASGRKVYSDIFGDPMAHISLSKDAELMLIAPATANIIAKSANGISDDLLSLCLLSFKGRVVMAPAMNWRMYESKALQRNLKQVIGDGVIIVEPVKGTLACGEQGIGKMADIETIIHAVKSELRRKDLSTEKILVTAGPTREYIDEVRFISNSSTGKMGYAIANSGHARGAEVTLISGPSNLKPVSGIKLIMVETALQMRDAVIKNLKGITTVVMASAVGDFMPVVKQKGKIPKAGGISSLKLKSTPDILKELGGMPQKPLIIGFSAEFGYNLKRAKEKLIGKGADMIVFNDISRPDSGFAVDTNKVVLISKRKTEKLPLMSKDEVADAILDRIPMIKAQT
ncbi:MAG: bifunctional phosphopantothenoylcysteine decarboxylase/phosphopantothenate--cysteine ligase CoaBC [Nitrospirae bacterium]|nr:bifunctional phosphopantothenoylcysteine decarboxylase/phosphopantothenate--cysteine ligase CoaBC [Nitrospirota bacterium]